MNKKTVLKIFVVLDVILAIVFVITLFQASEKLTWAFYESKSIMPNSMLNYMDWENYGDVGVMSRSGRVGNKINAEDQDLYLLGEYADLLFWEKIQKADGNHETAAEYDARQKEIRKMLAGYEVVFDKMDQSIASAVRE